MQAFPQPLQAGARIGVVAPAGIYSREGLELAVSFLEGRGFKCVLGPRMDRCHRYLAGTDTERLQDLEWGLRDPDLDALWVARGGYGINRLLEHLNLEGLDERPVIGFSDVTSLLVALYQIAGKSGIHGPVLHSLTRHPDAESVDHILNLLTGRWSFSWPGEVWRSGTAAGPVIGGNLCMLASLCGTPWQLRARGCILLVEEVGEPPYRVDRMLQQLRSAGVLDGIAGVAVGSFTGFSTPEDARWGLRELILEAVDVPVIGGLPVGHGTQNRGFVYGAVARIEGERLVFQAPTDKGRAPQRGTG